MANRKYRNSVQVRKAKNASNLAYKKKAQTLFAIRFHNVNDEEIITKLKQTKNKTDYIRQLIFQDIAKEGE